MDQPVLFKPGLLNSKRVGPQSEWSQSRTLNRTQIGPPLPEVIWLDVAGSAYDRLAQGGEVDSFSVGCKHLLCW